MQDCRYSPLVLIVKCRTTIKIDVLNTIHLWDKYFYSKALSL